MKRSKTLLSVVLAVMTIGLVACDNNPNTTTTPSTPGTPDVQHTYALTYNGEAKAGSQLTFVLTQDGSMISQSGVTYTISDETKGTVSGNKITFTEGGTYTVSATYNGSVVATLSVTIEEGEKIYTIAEVLAEANKGNTGTSNLYTIKAKVTASAGSSAYIADATGGMYIYNWSYNNDDTAIKNKKFVAGDSIQLTAYVTQSYGAYQFSNYSSGRVDGTSAVLLTDEVTAMSPIALDETSYKALTANDHAKLYTFEAEYVSNAPTTAGTGKSGTSVYTNFKLGETAITLYYDKYDTTLPASASNLTVGSKYQITAPMRWYDSDKVAQFAYCSSGTEIVEIVEPLAVTYSGKTRVGKTLTLTTKASGTVVTEGVTYSITSGSENATLNSDGTLTLTGAGQVTVQASYTGADGTALTATTTITIAAALAYTSLAEVANISTKGTEFTTDAYVIGMSTVSSNKYTYVYLGNGTSGLYLYNVDESLLSGVSIGDLIRIEAMYDPSYLEGYNVESVTKLSENTNGVAEVVDLSYTSANAAALANADSGRRVTLTNAKVTSVSVDSKYSNVTATLSLNDVEYNVYLDSRYNDVTVAKTLQVGYNVTLTGCAAYYSSGKYTRIQTLSSIKIEESFYLSQTTGTIVLANSTTLKLSAGYVGGESTESVTWASSDTAVATVAEDGTVTGVSEGTTTITATKGNLTATCEITVVAKAAEVVSLEFNATNFTDAASFTGTDTYEKAVTIGTHGITVKVEKGTNNNGVKGGITTMSSSSELRLYKGSILTITFTDETFTKVSFVDSSSNPFATPTKTITPANTITGNDVEFTSATNTFTLSADAQIRMKSLKFTMSE